MTDQEPTFNAPPGWDLASSSWTPPTGWNPPPGWRPVQSWPPAPAGWKFWVSAPVATAAPAIPVVRPAPIRTAAAAPDHTLVDALRARVRDLEAELQRLRGTVGAPAGAVDLDDERVLQEVGIYRYHHPLENAVDYKDRLAALSEEIKNMAKGGDAILASDLFTYNNSLGKGRKMTADFSKLMLRAYNSEADSCVRALRAGNVVTAKRRLEASATAVARLGAMMEMRVNPAYHALRNTELELTADYLMKVQVEKEEARDERARLREEQRAAKELADERERLDKERAHYSNALEALRVSGDATGVAKLNDRLEAIDRAIEHNDFRVANIRAGYVYVISNVGAFGPGMVKIGLTRRLKPLERVAELGGASVPFPFDVHALYFADDAVDLEAQLHRQFADLRVNHVNLRREFFFATPSEVRAVLAQKVGNLLEFTEQAEATQYLQSKSSWPEAMR